MFEIRRGGPYWGTVGGTVGSDGGGENGRSKREFSIGKSGVGDERGGMTRGGAEGRGLVGDSVVIN